MGRGNICGIFCTANIPVDNTCKFCFQFLRGFTGQRRHIFHIHPCLFRNGYGKGFTGSINACYSLMGTYGTFGKHIRLALEVTFFVQYLQRTQEVIAGVITECKAVATAAYQPVFCSVLVIQGIKLCLLFQNVLIRVSLGLEVNQLTDTLSQGDHATDAVFCCDGHFYRIHTAVFTEIHFAV